MAERGEQLLGTAPLRARLKSQVAVSLVGVLLCSVLVLVWVHAIAQPRTTSLAVSFDANSLYPDDKSIDHDHPNRIDEYGCLFAGCAGVGAPSFRRKVAKLAQELYKLKELQSKFDRKLGSPVQTSMSILPGEPGRLGARGDRGRPGPQGYPGKTGTPGRPGVKGRPGRVGDEGTRGAPGRPGRPGDRGVQGVQGPLGPTGFRGIRGNRGSPGKRGPRGYKGDNGPAGQDGQPGAPGKPGSAAAGPPGVPGQMGPPGPRGDRGSKGLRGRAGVRGTPGPAGLAGIPGVDGAPGRDAKQTPASACKGTSTPKGESVCCGMSEVNWHSYYSSGSYIQVNTGSCKFDGTPKYFTSLIGNGYIERINGGSSIYSPSHNSFRVYLSEDITHVTPTGHIANVYRFRVKWCGVGKSNGPSVPNVCCGTEAPGWGNWWWSGYRRLDAGACEMKGNPMWITAAQGGAKSGPDKFVGYNAGYGQTYRYSWMYLRGSYSSQNYWGHFNGWNFNKGAADQMQAKWCVFGEPFPTGAMRVNTEQIKPDEYPCTGIRVVYEGTIKTNQAQICCGATDSKWMSKGGFQIYKDVDTSSCNFASGQTVVYLTSVGGNGNQWKASGTTAYVSSSPTGFSMSLGMHEKQSNAAFAEQYGWYVNWCGIGTLK